jgi:hypothetical protein
VARDWLYPLSSTSDYCFELRNGKTLDTGPASFEEMIIGGRADDQWGAYRNWKKAQKDDRVWVYYGHRDGDIGVVGLGRIESVEEPSKPRGRATVNITWDAKTTKKLLRHPFPAKRVRQYIPKPQTALWEIASSLARQLNRHARIRPSKRVTASEPNTKASYANGKQSTISYKRPTKRITIHRRHDALLRPLKARLQSIGGRESKVKVQSKRVDLAVKLGRTTLIVEAKTISSDTSPEVRAAFAQLFEYRWRIQRGERSARSDVQLWALFEKRPTDDEIGFLEDQSILVSWAAASQRRICHGPHTAVSPIVKRLGD